MSWSEDLLKLIGESMGTHKATAAVAGTTATLGAAGMLDLIHTGLSALAIGAAVVCTLALARYHRANERFRNLEIQQLEEKLRAAGIEPKKE